jgi:hypothetical protein
MRLLLFLIVACGGAKHTSSPVGNRAAPPPKPACTDERIADITRHLEQHHHWNTTRPLSVRCTPGRFPTPGFFIDVDDGTRIHHGVLADDCKTELVPFDSAESLPTSLSVVDCATDDLDGDGIDEIIESWRLIAPGYMGSDNWLEIRRIDAKRFTQIRGPHTNVFHPELGSCAADVKIAGRTIVIVVVDEAGLPPSDCLPAGTHAFALGEKRLFELR